MKNKNISSEPPISGALTEPFKATPEEMEQIKAIIRARQEAMTPEEKRQVALISMKYKIQNYLEAEIAEEEEIITAGQFLRMYLENLNIKQNKFAAGIGLKPANLSKILSGERKINIEQSLMFGQLFSTDPKVWLMIHLKNDYLRMERKKDTYADLDLRQFAMAG